MSGYRIDVLKGARRLDPHRDNVDVEVHFEDGRRYTATFFTLESIRSVMKAYEKSGECAGGLYFFATDMILVRKLTEETIERTVADLIANDELEAAFGGPHSD